MTRKPLPPRPPDPSPLCHLCNKEPATGEGEKFLCAGCVAYWTTLHNLLDRYQTSDDPVEVKLTTAVLMYQDLIKISRSSFDYRAKVQALADWHAEIERRKQLSGRTPKHSTAWLRENHRGRSMRVVYPEWLSEDGSEDTPETWERYRRLWRREFGGNK